MVDKVELVKKLIRLIYSKGAGTFFLNAPPGSGKSYLLSQLDSAIRKELPHICTLGPYPLRWTDILHVNQQIMRDCYDAGFLDITPPPEILVDALSFWRWFLIHADLPPQHTFLILFDLLQPGGSDIGRMAQLFSNVRNLEGKWGRSDLKIAYLLCGGWDHEALLKHYNVIRTSFPYTEADNYGRWPGISQEEMRDLSKTKYYHEISPLHSRILHELSGGHPRAAIDILARTPPDGPSLATLLSATQLAAANGPASQGLLDRWQLLTDQSRNALRELVLHRLIRGTIPAIRWSLQEAGIARIKRLGGTYYLGFASWYVELIVRQNLGQLGIEDGETRKIRVGELMPEVTELNAEAYRLINEIENMARNFAATHLCLTQPINEEILVGKDIKRVRNQMKDAHQRASRLRNISAAKGLRTDINPTLAYSYTSELASLIYEIAANLNSIEWLQISEAIQELTEVRNAVMHNQLIDDVSLQKLHALQTSIYEASVAS